MLPKDVETIEQILTERQQNLPRQEKMMVYITENSLPKNRIAILEGLFQKGQMWCVHALGYLQTMCMSHHLCSTHKSALLLSWRFADPSSCPWEPIVRWFSTWASLWEIKGASHKDLERFLQDQAFRNISRSLHVRCLPLFISGREERNLGRR